MITETHIVPKEITPERLQEYGVGIFSSIPTKSALKKALKKHYIKVNGEAAGTATFITGGETLKLILPQPTAPGKKLDFELKIIFEDEHLAVIHKPAGIVVSGNSFKTITNALPQNLKPSILPDATTPRPVHRLDLATTGLLLVGKTHSSIRALNKLFEDKNVKKTYYAITIGKMDPCGRVTDPVDTKQAATRYRVCDSVLSNRFAQLNLVQLQPETGRRHQLRKHLAGMGNPILGDKEYGQENLILQGKGLYLHAFALDFIHPFTRKKMHLEAELPKKFRKIFQLTIDN
jgi:23S rRNA pseudouridine1911/1915/1917 synthase